MGLPFPARHHWRSGSDLRQSPKLGWSRHLFSGKHEVKLCPKWGHKTKYGFIWKSTLHCRSCVSAVLALY